MKRLLIILISLLPFQVFSQSIDQCYTFACDQMEVGNYEIAIENFRRVLFFDKGDYDAETSLKLAGCYSRVNEYDNAIKFYDLAYVFSDSDSLQSEILFKKAEVYILSKNYNFALIELMNMRNLLSEAMIAKANFYKGVIYFQLENFDKSESYFSLLHEGSEAYLIELREVFDETRKLKRYNPRVTKFMSLLIPGSGQLYVGDYKNAANSFVLNAGIILLFGHVARQYSLADAYLSIFPWYQRYYVGGFRATAPITIQKRQERKEKIYLKLITLLETN